MAHTLLLADDSGTTHRVIELTFAEQGVRVVSVADGDQAVEKLSTERPDIVLVATGLPKVDGYELASYVKRQPALSHVPVLLLTGAFDTIDEARVQASGAAGILIKPFEPGTVLNRVRELLGIASDTPHVPSSTTGQLMSQDAPRARAPMGASWQPPPPKQLDPLPPPSSRAAAARERTTTPEVPGSWDQLRQDTGLGDAQHVEGPGSGSDYFDQLDAAFDTLDAQLAGKAAPRGRVAPPPPVPRMPAAIDPAMRPAAARDLPMREAPSSQDEIDTMWDTGESPTVVETAKPVPPPAATGPTGVVSRTMPTALPPHAPAPRALIAQSNAVPAPEPRADVEPVRPAPPAPGAATSVTSPLPEMADAFAALLAAEQGEPVNHQLPAMEVNDEVIDRIASRVADKLSHSLLMDHVTRIVSDVAERVVREEIARIRAAAQRKS